jgi:DNA-binding HxlR family transcriptional regulator
VLNRTYRDQACSIARALEVVGERWTLLILRDTYRGIRRFDDLQASLGITRGVLTQRLSWLVDEGLLERRPYQTNPQRFEYLPTTKGRALSPVLMHLLLWGDRYYPSPGGPPQIVEHTECGGLVTPQLTCDQCGQQLRPSEISIRPRTKPARSRRAAARRADVA